MYRLEQIHILRLVLSTQFGTFEPLQLKKHLDSTSFQKTYQTHRTIAKPWLFTFAGTHVTLLAITCRIYIANNAKARFYYPGGIFVHQKKVVPKKRVA